MGFFECCHHCVAPKRHPGCHITCPEYIKQRKKLDEHNEVINQKKFNDSLAPGISTYVYKPKKH